MKLVTSIPKVNLPIIIYEINQRGFSYNEYWGAKCVQALLMENRTFFLPRNLRRSFHWHQKYILYSYVSFEL